MFYPRRNPKNDKHLFEKLYNSKLFSIPNCLIFFVEIIGECIVEVMNCIYILKRVTDIACDHLVLCFH